MKEFSEDEKAVARSIDKEYRWMARNINGCLGVYKNKPKKMAHAFDAQHFAEYLPLYAFGHMFKSIRWEDDEPTLIRDIYDPQVLDDVEREYLKTVLKPFYEKVVYVAKYRVPSASGKDGCSKEQLSIAFYSGGFVFPDFDPGKMYSGMELGKSYKLDELGIIYTEEAQNG